MIQKQPLNQTDLPDPQEYPLADVVVYDGRCKFCTSGVRRIHRWDGKHRLSFLSLHDPRVEEFCPQLSHQQLMDQMYVLPADGNEQAAGRRALGGAAGFRYLTRRLPRLWILAPFMHVPFSLPFWQWAYRQIARRRYQLGKVKDSCEDGTCDLHSD